MFHSVGNRVEYNRLLIRTLKLWRGSGNDIQVAITLGCLYDTNRLMGLHEEGIQQAKETSEIFERFGDTNNQAECLINYDCVLYYDKQLDTAEEAGARPKISALPRSLCPWRCISFQGQYREGHSPFRSSPRNCIHSQHSQSVIFGSLRPIGAVLRESRFDDAHAHVERVRLYVANGAYLLSRASRVRLGFGIGNIGLKRQNPRHCTLSMCSRSSGLRMMRR